MAKKWVDHPCYNRLCAAPEVAESSGCVCQSGLQRAGQDRAHRQCTGPLSAIVPRSKVHVRCSTLMNGNAAHHEALDSKNSAVSEVMPTSAKDPAVSSSYT
jgi:hypothetical protein